MFKDESNFFSILFNKIQSLVAVFNLSGWNFIQVNEFGLKMFEFVDTSEFSDHFLNGSIWPVPPPDMQQYLSSIAQIVHERGYVEKEMVYNTTSGKRFWGLMRIDSLIIKDTKHLLIKITNIDHFKNVESTALPNVQELQALFNSTIGIIISNSEGSIINFNPFAELLFGYNKDEVLGHAVELLIPHKFHNRHNGYRTAFNGSPQNRVMGAGRELYALRKDHTEFPVEISLSHYQIDGKYYVIAFVVDISVRKNSEALVLQQKEKLEIISTQISQMNTELEKKVEDRTKMLKETFKELERSQEELRAALDKERELGELKSRFVTMASHEFRTPLSTIQTSAYIAQQYTTTEDQEKRNKHLLQIQSAVQVLTFILEDFLSLERLEKGFVLVNFELVSVEDLIFEIENILDEMKQSLKHGQGFQLITAGLTPVLTDKKLLRNILVNLISNASKYSPENSIININCLRENDLFKISIADKGIGIPLSEQKHLFERFFRATNAATIQGTGLGLHIVNRYLKLINGSIELSSELNKGTTFTIVLNASTLTN